AILPLSVSSPPTSPPSPIVHVAHHWRHTKADAFCSLNGKERTSFVCFAPPPPRPWACLHLALGGGGSMSGAQHCMGGGRSIHGTIRIRMHGCRRHSKSYDVRAPPSVRKGAACRSSRGIPW